MVTMTKNHFITLIVLIAVLSPLNNSAYAVPVVAFEWLPGMHSNQQSFHNTTGPVVADDFIPTISGTVTRVDWWGTRTMGSTWEITFHNNNINEPAFTPPNGGISQHFANAAGIDPDMDTIFEFSTAWNPQDVFLNAGQDYWFSVANTVPGWNWANVLGAAPTVGNQQFSGHVSVGGAPSLIGGPHDGPWNLVDQNFAFRIWVEPVPLPATFILMLSGLFGLAIFGKKDNK